MDITFKGSSVHTVGSLPPLNTKAPHFTLVKTDLSPITLIDLKGKNIILNIFISLDTAVCAASVRKFNEEAATLPNTQVLCVSMDLPFAQQRFCALEGIENVMAVSAFRHAEFGNAYGVTIVDGPLKGLLSRAIVIIDSNQTVIYREQVKEITHEPNYTDALKTLTPVS